MTEIFDAKTQALPHDRVVAVRQRDGACVLRNVVFVAARSDGHPFTNYPH